LLEAFPAKYRTALGGTKRHRRFFTALGTIGFCFRSHRRGVAATSIPSAAFGSLRLTAFAALGFVLEAFVGEKHLLAGRKYKF
jgi:hypothetical protein